MPIMTKRSSAISLSASKSVLEGSDENACPGDGRSLSYRGSDDGSELKVRKGKVGAVGGLKSGKFLRNSDTVDKIVLSIPDA